MRHGKRIYGVPCGGIGAGTIGRGFRMEFCRFQMVPGMYSYNTVWADAFHLCLFDAAGEVIFKSVLASNRTKCKNDQKTLSAWEYNIRDEDIQYRALYPRSWTTFKVPQHDIELTCEQLSPFIPHNYKDSSLPISLFRWKVKKSKDSKVTKIRIGFTFKNGWGSKDEDSKLEPKTESLDSESFTGMQMHQKIRDCRLTYAIAVKQSDSITTKQLQDFDPLSDGKGFYEEFVHDKKESLFSSSYHVAMGVMAESSQNDEEIMMDFALCWDMPIIQFRAMKTKWNRMYTRYFNKEENSGDIISYAFQNMDKWSQDIDDWQSPILQDPELPDWFKSAVFNEMYYIADGGTQWLLSDNRDNLANDDPRIEFGTFLYLESHEYRLYNTYDVHFYASMALAALFPGIQLSIQVY